MKKPLKGIRILITAGATRVYLDDIRYITNTASGKLGSMIAELAAKYGAKVMYIFGEGSILPAKSRFIQLHKIVTIDDLMLFLKKELKAKKYDAVIHSMGVSDYVPFRKIKGKLSSAKNIMCIKFKKAPKIINSIKKLSPGSFLVGFKLESNITEAKLIKEAKDLMKRTNADLVAANDYKKIKGVQHKALIINRNGNIKHANSKYNIANCILNEIKLKYRR